MNRACTCRLLLAFALLGFVSNVEATSLFDGSTLNGWKGKPGLWSVKDGAIVGKAEKDIGSNTFLVFEKPFENFILSLDFQLTGGNSGVQFRSVQVDKPEDFVVSGYQADIGDGYFGGLYDEKRRDKMLAEARKDWTLKVMKEFQSRKKSEWNHYEVRAIGNQITLILDGLVTAEYTEKDDKIPRGGILALQMHAGGPMEVRFKNIQIEEIPQKKLLYVTTAGGFAHSSRPLSRDIVAKLGRDSGRFLATTTDTPELVTADGLKGFDAVLFYTTGGMDDLVKKGFTKAGLEALVQWVKDGHAFLGVHSATDTLADWQPYWEMIGGSFDGHPWGAGDPAITVDVEDPSHPAALPIEHGWKIQDEIYQMKNYSRDRIHVILSMNEASYKGKQGAKRTDDNDYAIAWCRDYGKGKVFYTSLGHREDVWTNPIYQAHLVGGILWSLNTPGYAGDATPGLKKPANDFVPLFDGKTLSGWTQNERSDGKKEAEWEVADGVLRAKAGSQHGHLFSPKQYENFDYKAEAKINDGGNSGMYFRTKKGNAWPDGYEAQVNSSHGDWVRSGSLYNIHPVYEQLVPPDTWFTQEIIAYGDHIIIKVNGKITSNEVVKLHDRGNFAFQFHDPTCKVQFRNVMVRELPALKNEKTASGTK
jgi:type 1 glutamine amidotransferase